MQINRLFEIVYILMDKKIVPARKLAERFEVSVRTIYRDIDVLCQAGIPVYMSKGKGGGISLMDNYILNKSILSDSEQNDILAALQSLNAVHYPEIDSVLSKLGILFNKEDFNWIDVDFSYWGESNREKFNLLKTAILNRKVIKFEYFNSYGQNNFRTVEPLQLWFKDKTWYLKAFCLTKQAHRIFKLTRIKTLEATDTTFQRKLPSNISFDEEKNFKLKIIRLRLHLDKSVAFRVYDEFDEKAVTKNNDGSFEVTVEFPESDWIYGYLMSFGSSAEIIEPEYIKENLIKRLNDTIKLYKSE